GSGGGASTLFLRCCWSGDSAEISIDQKTSRGAVFNEEVHRLSLFGYSGAVADQLELDVLPGLGCDEQIGLHRRLRDRLHVDVVGLAFVMLGLEVARTPKND